MQENVTNHFSVKLFKSFIEHYLAIKPILKYFRTRLNPDFWGIFLMIYIAQDESLDTDKV